MLHTEAVEPGTLSLLKELMAVPVLGAFSLVGGTALALRYGHRNSVEAVLGRAQKKDFWDLYELLRNYPLQQLMDWQN